jgi:hypothetical protein
MDLGTGLTQTVGAAASEPGPGGLMTDKSPHRANDKKRGKSLQEKRAAKKQKRAERRAADQARDRAEGL